MWKELKILVDGYNPDTYSRVELVEVISHTYFVKRFSQTDLGKPDYVKEVKNDIEGSALFSRLMSEKLELF